MVHPAVRAGCALAVALVAAAAPSAAAAAYAPQLQIKVDPATYKAAPALTSTITQGASETASKTVVVDFPNGFTAPQVAPKLATCNADQEAARSCPDGSRVGAANAQAAVVGLPVTLSGNVYYGTPQGNALKLIVFLDNGSLNQHLTVEGLVTIRPDGGIRTTFDNLPNTTTTSFTLALLGGDKALVTAPSVCGNYTFTGRFTSQSGETASSTSAVAVSGCPPPKVGSIAYSGGTLTYYLSEPSQVTVIVKGPKMLKLARAGHVGTNRIGKLYKSLPAGKYRVSVSVVAPDGQKASAKGRITLRPHKSR